MKPRALNVVRQDVSLVPLVLAAGFSRRFGSDKRAHLLDGKPMLQHVLEKVLAIFECVVVCVHESVEQAESSAMLERSFLESHKHRVLFCPVANAEQGMSCSLVAGVDYIEKHFDADGLLVFLADMPFIKAETLQALIKNYQQEIIVYPVSAEPAGIPDGKDKLPDKPGHPVIFSRAFIPELLTVQGDSGGKSVIKRNMSRVININVNDAGIYRDVDVP